MPTPEICIIFNITNLARSFSLLRSSFSYTFLSVHEAWTIFFSPSLIRFRTFNRLMVVVVLAFCHFQRWQLIFICRSYHIFVCLFRKLFQSFNNSAAEIFSMTFWDPNLCSFTVFGLKWLFDSSCKLYSMRFHSETNLIYFSFV